MDLAPGTMVTRNIRLRRRLGEGAMGSVWVAEHLTLKLDVAVKFISGKLAIDDPEVLARFEREASTAARIKSDHVVQTHDCGVMEDGTPYIVMELLEGESLRARLDRGGSLSLQELGRVVGQTARALHKAHQLGFVHRDIKPDNIFLCNASDGCHVKLLDFGVAQPARPPRGEQPGDEPADGSAEPGRLEPEASHQTMAGTLQFLSPEQFKGEGEVDLQLDLWALAVVAYRCLTERFPFNGETAGLLCVSVLTGKFTPPSAVREDLPPVLDDWFARALHTDRDKRFSSAKEMALALARMIPATHADVERAIMTTGRLVLASAPDLPRSLHRVVVGELSPLLSSMIGLGRKRWSRSAMGVGVAAVMLAIVIGAAVLAGDDTPQHAAADAETTAAPSTGRAVAAAPSAAGSASRDGGSEVQAKQGASTSRRSLPAGKRARSDRAVRGRARSKKATRPTPVTPWDTPPAPKKEDYGF